MHPAAVEERFDCAGPAFADRDGVYGGDHGSSDERHCAAARDWPKPVADLDRAGG
ncbi:hypothetical protein [Streptomyces longisporus]|uniref:Uncharacterized protein n=1 Tax=Streptomyces longisporus TaxID=1948 RepID=A0ABP6A0F3_STRLO